VTISNITAESWSTWNLESKIDLEIPCGQPTPEIDDDRGVWRIAPKLQEDAQGHEERAKQDTHPHH
jgi:hypothetical protein